MRRATPPSNHRKQRGEQRRKNAPVPPVLGGGRFFPTPPIIVVPRRPQPRHSHLVGLRSVINTSNTAQSHPQLHVIKIGLGAIDRNRQRHFGTCLMKARSSVLVATLLVSVPRVTATA